MAYIGTKLKFGLDVIFDIELLHIRQFKYILDKSLFVLNLLFINVKEGRKTEDACWFTVRWYIWYVEVHLTYFAVLNATMWRGTTKMQTMPNIF